MPARRSIWARPAVVAALAAQVMCVVGFLVAMSAGQSQLAIAILVAPLQILLFVATLQDPLNLLLFQAVLLAAVGFELLPKLYVESLVLLAPLALVFFIRVVKPPSAAQRVDDRARRWDLLPFAVFAVMVVVSGVNSVFGGWASPWTARTGLWALESALAVWAFASVPRTTRDVRRVLVALIVGYVIAMFTFLLFGRAAGFGGSKMVRAIFGDVNMNQAGVLVAPMAALLMGVLCGRGRRPTNLLLVTGLALALILLVVSRSRGAWLGFAFAFLYLLERTRRPQLVIAGAVGVVAVFAAGVLRDVVVTRVADTSSQDLSLLGRILLWKCGADAIAQNWLLGIGLENFRFVKYQFGYPRALDPFHWFNTHSLYLEILVGLGLPGLAAFLWGVGRVLVRAGRMAGRDLGETSLLAVGLTAAIIAYGVHVTVDAFTYSPAPMLLLGILLGMALSVARLGASTSDAGDPSTSRGEPGASSLSRPGRAFH